MIRPIKSAWAFITKAYRRCYYGPQPDRQIFRDIGIPDGMPIPPAQRLSVLRMKRLLLRVIPVLLGLSAIVGGVAAVVGLFR